MRHTFATLAISAGENINWVARMLGHKSPVVTLEKYNRFVPNLTRADGKALREAGEKIAKHFAKQKKKFRKINKLSSILVVPTGLFQVKTGIYMPNKFRGLDRKPFNVCVKNSENFPIIP